MIKGIKWAITGCLMLFGGVVAGGLGPVPSAHAASTVKTRYALGNYQAQKLKWVRNKNEYVMRPKTYAWSATYQRQGTFQTRPATYKTCRGNTPATLTTDLYLPVTVRRSGDWGNPQSLVLTKNDRTAYVGYLKTGTTSTGWIVKYDLAKLRQKFGATTGNMALIRQATNVYSKGKVTARQKTVMTAMRIGPTFDLGHGQSLALNPRTQQLWLSRTSGEDGRYGSAVRVSPRTLRPVQTVDYRLVNKIGAKIAVNSTLTFDKRGYAYFSSYSGKRALRVYRGTISKKGVHFKLVMQGLKYRPGQTHQSIAYNAKNDRLYFVSDDAISSVPLAKLNRGRVKPKDVKATVFASHREFEGLSFTGSGQAYVLLNRGPEVMRLTFK